jgi:hypothetical protein
MGRGKRAWGGGDTSPQNEVTVNLLSKKLGLMLLYLKNYFQREIIFFLQSEIVFF